MMTGQSLVGGTIASYAGGTIQAIFYNEGGGSPAVISNSANIKGHGSFSVLAWDNTSSIYVPSQTTFIIQVGRQTQFATRLTISGGSQDISTALAAAPAPPAS
jgi:hypothetical protein